MPTDNLIKILFRFHSDILDKETVETMWATVVNAEFGYYRLENIPFYISNAASGDVVWAEYNPKEDMLTYRKTVKYSGKSTLRIILMDNGHDVNSIKSIFEEMGCQSESLSKKYFVMEVPADVDYSQVKEKLDELQKDNIIGYAESFLSDNHQYKNVL